MQGAIADLNQSLKLNPSYAIAYYNRGLARNKLSDKQSALADFQQAAVLAQKQGNGNLAQKIQKEIKKIQQ